MSEYNQLKPIFASSILHVVKNEWKLQFFNTITYDYLDIGVNKDSKNKGYSNFYDYLKLSKNFNNEIELAWNNLQNYLDEEENYVNDLESPQSVKHCNIFFRDNQHPFFQWLIEFEAPIEQIIQDNPSSKTFDYVNYVPPETLQYPTYSIYHFHDPLILVSVSSSMKYNLNIPQGIIEYYGDTGDELSGEEKISFNL